jgi:hypothetical protein
MSKYHVRIGHGGTTTLFYPYLCQSSLYFFHRENEGFTCQDRRQVIQQTAVRKDGSLPPSEAALQ